MALNANGMTREQVELVAAGDLGANQSAVTSGAVDAGFSDMLIYSQRKDLVQPVFYVKDVMSPRMMQTVCITTADYAKDHPDIVRGIIAAPKEGLDYLTAHPDEAADVLAQAYNNTDTTGFRKHMNDLIAIKYWSDGRLDYAAMAT